MKAALNPSDHQVRAALEAADEDHDGRDDADEDDE
jgi:hypothetical protein